MRRQGRSESNTAEISSHSIPAVRPKTRPNSCSIPGYTHVSTLLSPGGQSLLGRPASDLWVSTGLAIGSQTPQHRASSQATSSAGRFEGSPSSEKRERHISQPRLRTERSLPRPVTRFALCQALPPSRQILHRRAQNLLQLRRINQRQPLPAIDVHLPVHCPCMPRDLGLLNRLPRLLSTAHKLCPNDILVTRSPYDKETAFRDLFVREEDNSKDQEVLAVISPFGQLDQGTANIVLQDGVTWVASRKANGSFEFSLRTHSAHIATVRWSRRSSRAGYHFNFCVVDPGVKSWPIQGTLTLEALDVYGTYSRALETAAPTLPVRSVSLAQALPKALERNKEVKSVSAVSEEHKRLMTVTAIWVSLCEVRPPIGAL